MRFTISTLTVQSIAVGLIGCSQQAELDMSVTPTSPPTRDQLVGPEPLSLDGEVVVEHFLGKDHAAARALFAEAHYTADDFMLMAPPGIRYYLSPAIDYIESDDSKGDWEFMSSLLMSLAHHAEESDLNAPTLKSFRRVADYVDRHHSKFEVESDDLVHAYIATVRAAAKPVEPTE